MLSGHVFPKKTYVKYVISRNNFCDLNNKAYLCTVLNKDLTKNNYLKKI